MPNTFGEAEKRRGAARLRTLAGGNAPRVFMTVILLGLACVLVVLVVVSWLTVGFRLLLVPLLAAVVAFAWIAFRFLSRDS